MSAPTSLAEVKNTGSVANAPDVKVDFFSKNGFDLACRMAKAFSTSEAVPPAFRAVIEKKGQGGQISYVENPAAIGNCLVAIDVARSIGASISTVMLNADMINGKLRWNSKFQIAAVNSSRRFTPLKFKLENLGRIKAKYKEKLDWNNQLRRFNFAEHEVEIDNWECTAWAYELGPDGRPTKEVCQSIPVSMQMAVEEGWYSREGSKWQGSMRFQMLQYRAGTFFASIYAPDIVMGMGRSSEEETDVIDVVQQPDGSFAAASATLQELRAGKDVGNIPAGINTETGEILDPDQQPQGAGEAPQQSGQSDGPTFEDAVSEVNAGNFDLARDIARSLPEGQQQAIEQAITNKQGGNAGSRRGRGERGSLNLE